MGVTRLCLDLRYFSSAWLKADLPELHINLDEGIINCKTLVSITCFTCEQLTHFPLNTSCMLSCFSHVWLCNHMDCSPPGSSVHGGSPGKNTGVGCHVLLQGSFWLTDQTRISYISCTGTLVFYHWATKETLDVDCLHLSGECPTVYTVFPHNSIMFNLIFIVS